MDDMKSEPQGIANAIPTTGFGAMSRDQLLELAKNPPRAAGQGDPMGKHLKSSEVTAGMIIAAQVGMPSPVTSSVGARCYHRRQKEECTIEASTEKPEVVIVKWDNGETSRAKLEYLTKI